MKKTCLIFFFVCNAVSLSVTGQPLFKKIPAANSGIHFTNTVTETDSLHIMRYEYLYNGHGIGVGDFNNDGLADLFFSGNMVKPALYLNKGKLQFENITDASGIVYNNTWATGVSVADVNADGLLDIYVSHSGYFADSSDLSNELWINQGSEKGIPRFKNMAHQYGLDLPGTQSTQAVFFDYDRDGDLDVFLVNHSNHTVNPFLNTRKTRSTPDMRHGNRLLRQDKNGDQVIYTDVTLASGIINNALNFGLSATVSDINNDGWPDIYTTSDYTETDCLYINNQNGGFTESLRQSFTHISKYSMGSDIADYNNDGLYDVLTLDMLPEDNKRQKLLKGPDEYDQYHLLLDSGYYHQQMRNMLHLNMGMDETGNMRFSEIGQLAGISNTDWSWSGLFSDFDNDGFKDLLITNGYLRDFTNLDFLKYTVANAQVEAVKNRNLDFKTFDLVKKMPSNKLSSYLFKNNGNLTFRNVTADWGLSEAAISNAAIYADLDNDGDADIVIGRNNEPVALYENQHSGSHYIKLRLKSGNKKVQTLGAKAIVYTGDNMQVLENYPVRGYQSSMQTPLLFGIGNNTRVDSLKIVWPTGDISVYHNLQADSLYNFECIGGTKRPPVLRQDLFADITAGSGIDFKHHENDFVDFKDEVLLPYQLSRMGPALAVADVNEDGLTDFFVGGAIGQEAALYIQTKEGKFRRFNQNAWKPDAACEDVNAVFFDADNDGDLDLYVVSGGNEYEDGSPEYGDRIYLNNGKGEFVRGENLIPAIASSKNAAAVGDFDNDGDIDIFVGGSCIAGSFPLASPSYIFENKSTAGKILFEEKQSFNIGMISAAAWKDIDGDNIPELITAGDWEPVRIFKKRAEGFVDVSDAAGLKNTAGMWSVLLATDVDGDGDVDIVAGNAGINLPYRASPEKPVEMLVADIDNNGRLDPIISYEIQGKYYPAASRDELLEQVVPMRKKFVYYKDYADATVEDFVSKSVQRSAKKMYCHTLESSVFINDGKGKFTRKAMPVEAQVSRVNGIIQADFDHDNQNDLLLSGNFFPYNVRAGRSDASLGMLLKNGTTPVYPANTGFFAGGDIRKMEWLNTAEGHCIIMAKNDDSLQLFRVNK